MASSLQQVRKKKTHVGNGTTLLQQIWVPRVKEDVYSEQNQIWSKLILHSVLDKNRNKLKISIHEVCIACLENNMIVQT